MGRMVSFLANPSREVTASDGSRWLVRLVRGNAWRGWPAEEALRRRAVPLGFDRAQREVTLNFLSSLPRAVLWVAYRVQGRKDWRVVVRAASAFSDREAVQDEWHPTKAAAAARASEVLESLRRQVT